MSAQDMSYKLTYYPGIPGRGEHIHLARTEVCAEYIDRALDKNHAMAHMAQIKTNMGGKLNPPPFAPPILKQGGLLIFRYRTSYSYLGPKLGLAPRIEKNSNTIYHINQLALTALDRLSTEAHNTHYPVSVLLYCADQKKERKRKAEDYITNRLPKFFGYFESVLRGKARGEMP